MRSLRLTWLLTFAALQANPEANSVANAQTFGPSRIASNSAHGVVDRAPVIQLGRGGAVYLAWFAGATDILFTRSDDNGKTFMTPVRAASGGSTNEGLAKLQRAPRFVEDESGALHIVWIDDRTSGQNIYYVRSTNRGMDWTTPKPLTSSGTPDFVAIAADSSGAIYVAYLNSMSGMGGPTDLLVLRSTDQGANWQAPRSALADYPSGAGTCECCRVDIATHRDSGGEDLVAVVFRSNIENTRNIYLAESTNGGDSWQPARKLHKGSWTITGCPATGPSSVFDANGYLSVVYRNALDDAPADALYLAEMDKNGMLREVQIDEGGEWPTLATGPNGSAVVLYQQGRDNGRLYYKLRSVRDSGWSTRTPLSTTAGLQIYASLAVSPDGVYHAVWQDGRRDGGDIAYATATFFASVHVGDHPKAPVVRVENNRIVLHGTSRVISLAICDVLGRKILVADHPIHSVDVSRLAPGTYAVVLDTERARTCTMIAVP